MHKLSTGDDSTLGNYRKLSVTFFGADSEAVKFLDKKIAESPNGENEWVIAPESQMMYLLSTMVNVEGVEDGSQ
jgi:hypothetical protein